LRHDSQQSASDKSGAAHFDLAHVDHLVGVDVKLPEQVIAVVRFQVVHQPAHKNILRISYEFLKNFSRISQDYERYPSLANMIAVTYRESIKMTVTPVQHFTSTARINAEIKVSITQLLKMDNLSWHLIGVPKQLHVEFSGGDEQTRGMADLIEIHIAPYL